jgi:hypothetical protein
MAAAYVSGSLALLRAQHPSESPAQLIARLRDSADSLPALQGLCVSGGRLNLRKALGVPVTAPSLSATGRAEPGRLEIGLLGDPGRVYLIEATRVWVDWLPVYTNTTDFEGRMVFTNFWQEAAAHEYFRARLLP